MNELIRTLYGRIELTNRNICFTFLKRYSSMIDAPM